MVSPRERDPYTHGTSQHELTWSEAATNSSHTGRKFLSHDHHFKGVFCRQVLCSLGHRAGEGPDCPRHPQKSAPSGSCPCPRQEIGEDEEGHDQPHGHTTQKLPVVSTRPRHCGKALHAPREQACHACEVRVLREESQQGHLHDCHAGATSNSRACPAGSVGQS